MSNAVRHVLGVIAGVFLTPLILLGLAFGTFQFSNAFRDFTPQSPGVAAAVLAATAALLGVLAGSRLSPIASIIAGLVLTGYGALVLFGLYHLGSDLLPAELDLGLRQLSTTGTLLVVGMLLLISSVFPARWRARRPAAFPATPAPGYPAAPYSYEPQVQPPPAQAAPRPFDGPVTFQAPAADPEATVVAEPSVFDPGDKDAGQTREFPSRDRPPRA